MKRRRQTTLRPDRLFLVLGVMAIVVLGAIGYVAYRANSGLPGQDPYEVTVEVPNANRLIATNEVRIGGIRVGQVAQVAAVPARGRARARARLKLALERSATPLPIDTTAKVRSAAVLGATFLDLNLGENRKTIPDGGRLPLHERARGAELIDLFDVFDRSTARNIRDTMGGLATGFTGRGVALNSAIGSVNSLLPPLTSVTKVLAQPETRLAGFIRGYESTFDALGPVSGELGGLFSGGARTFEALASERRALADAIAAAPAAESATTRAFQRLRPGLDGLARLAADLEPASQVLPRALRQSNATLVAGVKPLRRLPRFSRHLRTALIALDMVSRTSSTGGALRKLTDLMDALERTLAVLAPAQAHCNVVALLGQNLASQYGTLGVGEGPALTNVGIATGGAQNESFQQKEPSPDLATSYYPNENRRECESGNEPFTGKQQFNNPPGLQSSHTRDTDPPPGVRERARQAGLLDPPPGSP